MSNPLSPAEYRKAVFIDFEGEGRNKARELKLPHMVGEFGPNQAGKGGKYHATYFRENWGPVKNGAYSASSVLEFSEYFHDLALRLESENSFLVFWSIHEETVMQAFLSPALLKRLEPRLRNLHPIGRRYANRRQVFGLGNGARGRSLEEFFEAYYPGRGEQMCLSRPWYAGGALGAAEYLLAYAKAGASHFVLRFAGDHEDQLEKISGVRNQLGW